MVETATYLERLREDLKRGGIAAGNGRLPSFRRIATQYQCSVGSIKKAVDKLQDEGVLLSLHGKGTFLADAEAAPPRRQAKIVGVIVLESNFWREIVGSLKDEWLSRGWFLAVYDATDEKQSPLGEREFLLKAQAEGFTSIVLAATPREPVNSDLFARLRVDGMRICHISPYCDDMGKETFFLLDHAASGRLAAAWAGMRGYSSVLYLNCYGEAPFNGLERAGVSEMADGLGLKVLPADGLVEAAKSAGIHKETVSGNEILAAALRDLPTKTAVLCPTPQYAARLVKIARELVGRPVGDLGFVAMTSNPASDASASRMRFDCAAQVRAALEHATEKGKSTVSSRTQRYFQPVFIDEGTL